MTLLLLGDLRPWCFMRRNPRCVVQVQTLARVTWKATIILSPAQSLAQSFKQLQH